MCSVRGRKRRAPAPGPGCDMGWYESITKYSHSATWLRHSVSRLRRRVLCPCKVASVVDGTGAFSPQTAVGCPCTAWMCTRAARLRGPDLGCCARQRPRTAGGLPGFRARSQPCARETASKTRGPRQSLDRIFSKVPAKGLKNLRATPKTKVIQSGSGPKRPRGKVRSAPWRPFSVSGGTRMNPSWAHMNLEKGLRESHFCCC